MATKDITDREVVQAYRDAEAGGPGIHTDDILEQRTGQPGKVVYSAMDRAYRQGLIDYGVSLRSGWLTPAGEALLEQKEPGGEPGP